MLTPIRGGAALADGTYRWAQSFVDSEGNESELSPYVEYTVDHTTNGHTEGQARVALFGFSKPRIGAGDFDPKIYTRRLYRTKSGLTTFYFIKDFETTRTHSSVEDVAPDASLTSAYPHSGRSAVTQEVMKSVVVCSEIDKVSEMRELYIFQVFPDDGDCYSDDTEILTDQGWKLFKDLNKNEMVMTINKDTMKMEWQKPIRYIEKDWAGNMVWLKSKTMDCMITPNHKVFLECPKSGKRRMVLAKDLKRYSGIIPKTGTWEGFGEESLETFGMDTKTFVSFIGLWLAEGCAVGSNGGSIYKSNYSVYITAKKNQPEIEALLKKTNLNWRKYGINYRVNHKKLWEYLSKIGNSHTKYIPENIKNLPQEYLQELIKWMVLGDGSQWKNKTVYYTVSKRLADDLGEVLLKVGITGNIYSKKQNKTGLIKKCDDYIYTVSFVKSKYHQLSDSSESYIKSQPYDGKIYCVEVPNHIVYVRRNGKPMFSGNSITGILSTDNGLLVFKKYSICMIYTEGDPANWRVEKLIHSLGCDEPNSILQVEDKVYFANNKQIFRFPDRLGSALSLTRKPTFDNLTIYGCAYDSVNQWIIYTGTISTTHVLLIYDLKFSDRDSWYYFTLPSGHQANCAIMKLYGTNAGRLLIGGNRYICDYNSSNVQDSQAVDTFVDVSGVIRTKTFAFPDKLSLARLRFLFANYNKIADVNAVFTISNPDTPVTNTYTDSVGSGMKRTRFAVRSTDSILTASKVSIQATGLGELDSIRLDYFPIMRGYR